jgi:hypothetical protein
MNNNKFLQDIKEIRKESVLHFVTIIEKLFDVYNDFARENGSEIIYKNNDDNLDEMLQGLDASDVVNRIFYGNYQKADAYLSFDGYGNITTFHYERFFDVYLDDSDFINFCDENNVDLHKESKGE